MRAAVENGADAVYLGLDSGFNARARATNFRLDNVDGLMEFLHRRCVKGYVTLNTLAFTDELPRMEEVGRKLAAADVDAVLVQDLGVARLLREVCPELSLHASTQMTLTSAECIAVAQDLGMERVVLPRELSISEIRNISSKTDMPLEAFIHGALCVAYSGQCLTSESLGGRSANRGQCAQACRLAYDLICDGDDVDLGDQKYLLSPQDLAAYALTTDLIEAGICSFKIEGRLKTPEYVANTVQHYRRAIDAAVAGRKAEFTRREINDVEMSFSRGFSPGWLEGCDHKMLVPATSSAKRGVLLGEVVGVSYDRVTVRLESAIAAGDGVVFEGDREQNAEQGGRVYEVFRDSQRLSGPAEGGTVELAFDQYGVDVSALNVGLKVWKTDDPKLNKRLRATFAGPDARRRVALDVEVTAIVGEPLRIRATVSNRAGCEVTSEAVLELARKHALTEDVVREQLGRLGATIFELRDVRAKIEGGPMVPLSVLGQLRREMIERLNKADIATPRSIAPEPGLPRLRAAINGTANPNGEASGIVPAKRATQLNALCRSLEQLRVVVEEFAANESSPVVYADFADIRQYRDAVVVGRDAGVQVFPATPRIQKPGEMGLFKAMAKHEPEGVLIRNLSGLAFFRDLNIPTVADFSLNVTNELTAEYLMRHGAERVTASYDMNRDQLMELVSVVPSEWLEIVIHQHMPMFHMEHCVFCSVLSPGTNKTNCGRPCDFHKVELRDRIGMEHPLTADVGCRNTLFNATPQSSAEVVPALLQRGVQSFRIEFLYDDATRVRETLQLYRDLLSGHITGANVWQQLQASNRVGVTRGTLEERRNPLAIL
ncbi:U32 family peptidase [Fuerstiella marisgermanici]|uniref:U32 family peptidase n=1 Tax=Fuerstiella marisgermanici TaxID=1891926 RepID=UPI001E5066E5|nr:U32 family peptidase [Fuerstiella marisgermanici]